MQFRPVKGMNDILPDEVGRWQRLEQVFRQTMALHGYSEIRTPLLEPTALFARSIGETTDVVEKQMFTLERSGESLALRPEGTASAARAYVTHAVHAKEPVTRWYYLGPMFRAEQPQRGRYRQFHQGGSEIFGDPGPACDAELIDMLYRFLLDIGVPELDVRLHSLGGPEARARYRDALGQYLGPRASELSEHARRRLEDNPLRILDSKDPRDRAVVGGAPSILESLSAEDRTHFDELCRCLDALETPYQVDPTLVRGLDYYTRTLFEISSSAGELGAQNTLLGGGRYDGMVQSLGGPAVPGIGFAMGIERLLLAMPALELEASALCYVAPLGAAALPHALRLGRGIRRAGIRAEVDGRGGGLKGMLRRANAMGARFCLILGDAELSRGTVQLKDLTGHTQIDVPLTDVVGVVHAAALGIATTSTATTGTATTDPPDPEDRRDRGGSDPGDGVSA